MTEKQRRFADEYLIDLNATRAYRSAYPSVKRDETAAAAATRLLKNVNVAAYIQKRKKKREKRTLVSQDQVIEQIKAIAFEEDPEIVSTKDRLRALELLGKHLGLFDPRKDKLDRKEQKARIKKLQAEAKDPESADSIVTVRFENMEEMED